MDYKQRLIKLIFTIIVLVIPVASDAAIKKAASGNSSITVDQYEIVDIPFKLKSTVENPFDLNCNAVFTAPSGAKQIVPCFYNGSGEWILRFSSDEQGTWKYYLQSDNKSLNNKKGIITITSKKYNDRKGPVVLDKNNPHTFFWKDRSPYFLMAFECDFLFALDYGIPNQKRLNGFLDKVKENGFNHIVMNVYANDVEWAKDKNLKNTPEYEFGNNDRMFPFLGSNNAPDYSSLNCEFFKNLDTKIESLNDRDIISHLMIYVWNKRVNWPKLASKADDMYFDYVVKRYQAFSNIVWDISKEALYYGVADDSFILDRIDRVRELDSYKRLVTVHDFGFCRRHSEKVDFIAHQDWNRALYDDMYKNYNLFKDKSIFNIEHGGYEECDYKVFVGNYINAEACLRRNYECAFAGAYSTYYWQGCSWNVFMYDFDSSSKLKYNPRFDYFKYMTEFFAKYPFNEFTPKPYLNSSGYCLSNEKGTYLFYVPKESYKLGANSILKNSKEVFAQWFNTNTGEYSDSHMIKGKDVFDMPANPWHMKNDAILIMKTTKQK